MRVEFNCYGQIVNGKLWSAVSCEQNMLSSLRPTLQLANCGCVDLLAISFSGKFLVGKQAGSINPWGWFRHGKIAIAKVNAPALKLLAVLISLSLRMYREVDQ